MSSYNRIEKLRYEDDASSIVALEEYIIFADDLQKIKHIVFKFKNNVTQQLLAMRFEVRQYDEDGNLLEKSTVMYNKFLAEAEEEFVPKAKLRVSYNCACISFKLLQAAFQRFVWKEGSIEECEYDFDYYGHDGTPENGVKGKKSTKSEQRKKYTQTVVEYTARRRFVLKDATRKNRSKLSVFFNIFAVIVIVTFTFLTVYGVNNGDKNADAQTYQSRVCNL